MYIKTKARELIITALKSQPVPINAEQLLLLIGEDKVNLATIYRNLDYFFTSGLLYKSSFNNINYYSYDTHNHLHYMICLSCHEKFDIACSDINFSLTKTNNNFTVISHSITLHGFCHTCQATKSL